MAVLPPMENLCPQLIIDVHRKFFFFYIKLGFESKFSVGFFLFNVSAVTPERDILDKLSTAFPLRLHCRHTVSVLQQPEQFFFIAYPFLYSLTKFAQTLCQV